MNPPLAKTEIGAQPGPQTAFLSSEADIVIFGGAAGGGKTFALLLEPLRHYTNPGFGAVIFRRTFAQIMNEGGLWDKSEELYPLLGAKSNKSDYFWQFPSGMTVSFAHMQHETDVFNYQGAEIPLAEFDELTHFTKKQFFYILSRLRSLSINRPYIRATCNPDPDSWVAEFISWWIAEDGYADMSRAGHIRWFVRVDDIFYWADTPGELKEQFPDSDPLSVTFIPSSVYDNKILLEKNPGYIGNLKALDPVEQARLLGDRERGGNWKVRNEAGKVFDRAWFEIVDALPAPAPNQPPLKQVRRWDLAATEAELKGNDPDWTVGLKMLRQGDMFYITDVVRFRKNPAETDNILRNTASQDGRACPVRWEIEGGASGKRDSAYLTKLFIGYDCEGVRSVESKVTRARPAAKQAKAGNIKLLRGAWNEAFLQEVHNFPDVAHDDQVDTFSGAFYDLTTPPKQKGKQWG